MTLKYQACARVGNVQFSSVCDASVKMEESRPPGGGERRQLLHTVSAPQALPAGSAAPELPHARSAAARLEGAPSSTPSDSGLGEKVSSGEQVPSWGGLGAYSRRGPACQLHSAAPLPPARLEHLQHVLASGWHQGPAPTAGCTAPVPPASYAGKSVLGAPRLLSASSRDQALCHPISPSPPLLSTDGP